MRHRPSQNPRGFTLIELMIVVSIIGLLSSVSMVGYTALVKRAKQSERRSAVALITQQVKAYLDREGGLKYPWMYINPPPPWSEAKKNFVKDRSDPRYNLMYEEWFNIDWQPSGPVYYHYYVANMYKNSWGTGFTLYVIRGDPVYSIAYAYYSWRRSGNQWILDNWIPDDRSVSMYYPWNFRDSDL